MDDWKIGKPNHALFFPKSATEAAAIPKFISSLLLTMPDHPLAMKMQSWNAEVKCIKCGWTGELPHRQTAVDLEKLRSIFA